MKIIDIISKFGLEIKAVGDPQKEIRGCYVSDMLSDVLANAKEGNLWITRQTHPNIIGVASIKELSGILIAGNKEIEPDTLNKACAENITVMTSPLQTFEIAGALYSFLTQGTEK
ncbi:MAG: hypothetical protein Q8J64_02405 [Thermodesulfovibrionales bacterium]|nr:hypothetical protein [Thermodesulfovibrionales bacterium]